MKALTVITFALILLTYCRKKEVKSPEVQEVAPKPISLSERLLSDSFRDSGPMHSLSLKFKKGRYFFTLGSEGQYWHNEGKWKVSGKKVLLLKPTVCKDYPKGERISCKNTFNKGFCIYKPVTNSLYYSQRLHCASTGSSTQEFRGHFSRNCSMGSELAVIPAGVRKSFKGRQIITSGLIEGQANVNLREQPDIKAKEAQYFKAYDDPPLNYLPAKKMVRVVARTREKSTVGKWSNYWYLINVDDTSEKWVFGEFIRFEDFVPEPFPE